MVQRHLPEDSRGKRAPSEFLGSINDTLEHFSLGSSAAKKAQCDAIAQHRLNGAAIE